MEAADKRCARAQRTEEAKADGTDSGCDRLLSASSSRQRATRPSCHPSSESRPRTIHPLFSVCRIVLASPMECVRLRCCWLLCVHAHFDTPCAILFAEWAALLAQSVVRRREEAAGGMRRGRGADTRRTTAKQQSRPLFPAPMQPDARATRVGRAARRGDAQLTSTAHCTHRKGTHATGRERERVAAAAHRAERTAHRAGSGASRADPSRAALVALSDRADSTPAFEASCRTAVGMRATRHPRPFSMRSKLRRSSQQTAGSSSSRSREISRQHQPLRQLPRHQLHHRRREMQQHIPL